MEDRESLPRVSAVVLAYKTEPWLQRCVAALLASEKAKVDVILVDNGCTSDDVEVLESEPGVTVVRPGENLGFAGGCNAGAAVATGDYLALVNGDAIVEPATLAMLIEHASLPEIGIAGASIRLADDPKLINAAGNPVHVLGLCWAGGLGQVESRTEPVEVTVASGACLLMRAELWRDLGGFDQEYFAYHEDTELSIRMWQRGLRVVYVPTAVAVHRYEFSRTAIKYYLIERNRLMFLSTLWSWRALLLLSPALLSLELAMLALATKQGWLKGKLRSYRWLAGHLGHLRSRRSQLRRELAVPDRVWMDKLTSTLDTTAIELPVVTPLLNVLMRGYWRVARRLI